MKKILIFSLAYYPHVGGAEVAIKEITDRGAPTDIEFHMLTMRFSQSDARDERVGNIQVHRVGCGSSYLAKILFIPRAAWAARRLHKVEHFDGAWAMMSYMTFPLTLLRICGVSLPYVLTLQEGDPFEHVFGRWYIKLFSPILRAGFRHASVVQTISTFLAEWARQGGYRGEVMVVPNGVDVARFSTAPSAAEQESARKIFGMLRNTKAGEVWLVTSSRLVHKNAVDDVIRALGKRCQEPFPNTTDKKVPDTFFERVHFLVLGSGQDEQMLKDLAQRLGVADRVHFAGYVSHEQMPAFLHACDIFIRPSRSEGMGNSFIEAMAAGLPVIATQEGGLSDFIFDAHTTSSPVDKSSPASGGNQQHPPTAWAVDKDSPEQIADAVRDITNPANAAHVQQILATAKKMVEETYDWDTIAKQMRERVFVVLCPYGRRAD